MNQYYFYHIAIACLASLCIGIFLFAYLNGYIIFKYPSYKTDIKTYKQQLDVTRKVITFHYWHNQKWHTEKTELIWHSNDIGQNITYLLNSWFTWLEEEHMITKKITVQTVLLSTDTQHAYISFDRNPFDKQQSTYNKWMLIESLLKTIREVNVSLNHITFLVHHQPLKDMHLDFTNPWPIHGFLASYS